MNRLWSYKTNPATGKEHEAFRLYLDVAHNGNADIDALLNSAYGDELARRLELYYKFDNRLDEEVQAYYSSLGLKKEMFESDAFYTRWVLVTPLHPVEGKLYPVVFMHHGGGNSLEVDEFTTGFDLIASREGFIVVYLQNSRPENVVRILQIIKGKYPVDTTRVYMTGYSQGGMQTTVMMLEYPDVLAAAAPGGNDIFAMMDQAGDPATQEALERLTKSGVPFMQMNARYDPGNHLPLNKYIPRVSRGKRPGDVLVHKHAPKDIKDPVGAEMWAKGGVPPFLRPVPNGDGKWRLEMLNKRLATLGCEPRNIERCLGLTMEDGECAYTLGFYADREEVRTYYDTKHFIAEIDNEAGMPMFRYVAVDNAPHWPPLMIAELEWEFFKRYRRNPETNKVELI